MEIIFNWYLYVFAKVQHAKGSKFVSNDMWLLLRFAIVNNIILTYTLQVANISYLERN